MSNKIVDKNLLQEKKKTATKAISVIDKNGKLENDSINGVCYKKQSSAKGEENLNHTFEIDKNTPMQWKVRVKKEAVNSESGYSFIKTRFNIDNVKPKRANVYITEVPQNTIKAVTEKSLTCTKEKSSKLLQDNSHTTNSRMLKPPSLPLNNGLTRKIYTSRNYEVGYKLPKQEQKNCKPLDGDTPRRHRSHWTSHDIGSASKKPVDIEMQNSENVRRNNNYLSPYYRPKTTFQAKAPVQKRIEKRLQMSSKKVVLSHINTSSSIESQQQEQNKEKYKEGTEGDNKLDKVQKYITKNGYVVRNSKAVQRIRQLTSEIK
jgi:hypothetical protein